MKKRNLIRTLAMTAGAVSAALIGGIYILHSSELIRAFDIPTNAMSPFLSPGDHILVETFTPRARDIRRGDVRSFSTKDIKGIYQKETQIYIKRIVGLPGDELVVRDRKLWINGKPQTEVFESPVQEYINPGATGIYSLVEPYKVPDGHYFVIGDNTANSADSRFWGGVPKGNFMHLYWMHYRRAQNSPPKP